MTDGPSVHQYMHMSKRKGSSPVKAGLYLFGGLIAVSVSILASVAALFLPVGQFTLHGVSTLPMLLGIGALTAAWKLLRAPSQFIVGPGGISLDGRGWQYREA